MGLAAELSYQFKRPNPFQRLMQAFGSTRAGAWFFSKTLRHLDDVVGRLSRGRASAPGVLAGLPVLEVTTTGRKSGLRRTSHLISVPVRETLAILGTNFGQTSTPAWVFNLEADPHAEVSFKGRSMSVIARPAEEAEYAEVMLNSASVYGGYAKYRQRITGRRVRIFVLEPA
ncbi:MAG: nitroreductase family deazaflavin-dependent oxidoreductase [Nocardioides sp.]|nr:nitroreductase family deazaflavin-dependent oxidoreductase [Nocardioides sp.]